MMIEKMIDDDWEDERWWLRRWKMMIENDDRWWLRRWKMMMEMMIDGADVDDVDDVAGV